MQMPLSSAAPSPLKSSAASAGPRGEPEHLFSRNSLGNFVYLAYAAIVLVIDFYSQPLANAAFSSGSYNATTLQGDGTDDYYYEQTSGSPYTRAVGNTNVLYVIAGSVHLFNALQYYWVWPSLGYSVLHVYQAPELLNIVEAALYLYTATAYSSMVITGPGRYLDEQTLLTHRVETAAAVTALAAAFGWCAVWWHSHARGPGRGLTLDDPECCALVCLVAASLLYVAYNGIVLQDATAYFALPLATSLYQSGDCIFFAGACFYALASFRDAGYFESFGVFTRCQGGGGGGGKGGIASSSSAVAEAGGGGGGSERIENAAVVGLRLSSSISAAAAAAAVAPPPKQWERMEEAGEVWYVNHWTGQSQWDKPAGFS
jgi:hypothetical protein